MSLKIDNGFNGVTDPDAGAYIAAVEAADGQLLEFAVGKAINDFVVGCKNDGTWNAIKASCILAGARTLNGALVPLVGTAPTRQGADVTWNYNRKTGLTGTSASNYIDSSRANNVDDQNSQHMSVFVTTATITGVSGTSLLYIGAGGGESGTTFFARQGINGTLYARNRSFAADLDLASGATVNFVGMQRSSASNYLFRSNNSTQTVTRTSQSPVTSNVIVFPANLPSGATYPRIAYYSIGSSIDLQKLDTRVTALINAFAAAIP